MEEQFKKQADLSVHGTSTNSNRFLRISSALFYAAASFFITICNKTVLTNFK